MDARGNEVEITRLASVTSTQDAARDLPIGSVVVADAQTAGRGRLDRRWEAARGTALLASFVLAPIPLASLAAGVAAAEACGPTVRLKWPNDVMMGHSKLGGILVEGRGDRAIVGIGINLTSAPQGAARLPLDRDQLLDDLIVMLNRWFDMPGEHILLRWRELSMTLGRRVRVELPNEIVEGLAEDIDAEGRLVVDGRPMAAGDVVHLHPA